MSDTSESPEAGDARPADQLAELLVYAPLGLALEARKLWPLLVDRGRGQVNVARATGRRALRRYSGWIEGAVHGARGEADAALRGLGLVSSRTAEPSATTAERPGIVIDLPVGQAPATERDAATPAGDGVEVELLAIPDYDSLSASQVVPRLPSLEGSELEQVRRYEADHRGRKTILNKIAQLQAS